jgi:hypothetical protein
VLSDLGEPYGIREGTKSQVEMTKALPTVVRNILFLPRDMTGKRGLYRASERSEGLSPFSLLDASGRKVMSLRPGANDVRGLAPGVYFVREEPQAASLKPQAIRKVVLTK